MVTTLGKCSVRRLGRKGLTDRSTISGILAMKAFRDQFSTGFRSADNEPNVTPEQASLIVAILSAGTFVGAIVAAPFGDKIGRRISLMIAVGIFSFGTIFQTVAAEISMMVAGR